MYRNILRWRCQLVRLPIILMRRNYFSIFDGVLKIKRAVYCITAYRFSKIKTIMLKKSYALMSLCLPEQVVYLVQGKNKC